MGQKFTYTQLVFGTIAFKLLNLGQMFWVAFHKPPTIILVHSSWQSWCHWVRFVGLLAHTCFFSSAHKCSIGLRSGLCDGHSNTLTLLSLSHFATTLEVCLQSLSIWKTHLRPSFNILMSWDVASIYPHNIPPSWCHLFCEVHQSLLQQSTPTIWCCHPRASRLGWCSLACKPPPFSSKHNDGHYGQTVLVLFHQTREHFFKKYDLCPHVQLQIVVWLFYSSFGAVASSLLSGLSGYVDIGLVLLWI